MITDRIQNISADSEHITEAVENMYKVIKTVLDLASQSNILGLNASNEAARAGEYGRGFAVVAKEISRMAAESKKSAVHIMQFLEQVKESIEQNNQSIQEIAGFTQEHSASIQELNGSFSVISTAAEELMQTVK
ncbi:methyl-accepting chemotaxis protein [Peribacillus sp. SCS-37]|uniref:methyl-accepting chemotaxis protein n=1 Tax=Paraperibacillus esterisolvens TaxID=3115296 RepID=UPI003905FD7A